MTGFRAVGLLAAGVLALSAAAARAGADPVGPPIGANRYQAAIGEAGDQDDFVGAFVEGEKLTVTVVAAGGKKATLRPVLVLVDPDGVERFAGAVTSANGLSTAFRSFVVDKSGRWAARVSGKDDTTGEYTVAFKVKAAPAIAFPKERLGTDQPLAKQYRFPGFDGATFAVSAVEAKGATPVVFRTLKDGAGAHVLDDGGTAVVASAVRKKNRLDLRGTLRGAGGDYEIDVAIPSGASSFALSISVAAPPRPVSKKTAKLSTLEPTLDAVEVPYAGQPGDTVTFTGANFSTSTPPVVIFGTSRATSVTPAADGKSLAVVVPPKTGDTFVVVYVVNPDGQGTARDGYFSYQPPPVISDLLAVPAGTPVRSARADGRLSVRLSGDHFEPGYVVKFGTDVVTGVTVVSETDLRFQIPVLPQGTYTVSITDPFRRTATSSFSVFLKTAPTFGANPYSPGAVRLTTDTSVTITGLNFEATDQLVFRGQNVASTFVDATTRRFTVPALAAGSYAVRLVDSIGTAVDGPDLLVKGPPSVTAVSIVGGPVIGTKDIPLAGGAVVQVDGAAFAANDAVTLGSTTITTFSVNTATRKTFTAPAGAAGLASLTITDGAGQSVTSANVVRYSGFRDATAAHEPAYDGTDSFAAHRGAAADLDVDGKVDDVVLVSPFGASNGTRAELTRVLYGDAQGVLQDQTATAIPAALSDSYGVDSWDAECVAVGDVDGSAGVEIVIGGAVSQYSWYPQVRVLTNDGAGAFTLDETIAPPVRYDYGVSAYIPPTGYYPYYYGRYIAVYGPAPQRGVPRGMALGDIDGDTDLDLVVGTDHYQARYVYVDPQYVDFSVTPPSIGTISYVSYRQYRAALRVYENRISTTGSFVDRSSTHVVSAGDSRTTVGQPAALHCRDLALGDLDHDGDLDAVVAWDDPMTVTSYGMRTFETYGTSYDSAHVATRVVLNNGSGRLTTDATSVWMPAGADPEFWHADRVAVADLNADNYPELILLLDESLDAWKGNPTRTRRALRVLRNDRTKFTDVSGTALPAPVTANADDFRGNALTVRDVNSDGYPDILISTTEALKGPSGANVSRLRVFYGSGSLTFTLQPSFGEAVTTDSGEALEILHVGDLGGTASPRWLLVGDTVPAVNPGNGVLRAQEWKR